MRRRKLSENVKYLVFNVFKNARYNMQNNLKQVEAYFTEVVNSKTKI